MRLDNREELVRWTGPIDPCVTDFDLIIRFIAQRGEQCVRDILGDFAFVVRDTVTRSLIAARDAFGVRPLYYMQQPDLIAFASRAELLAEGEHYDLEYLGALAGRVFVPLGHTVYAGVSALPDGATARLQREAILVNRYWSATDIARRSAVTRHVQDLCDEFRDLLLRAVRLRMTDDGATWSMLSGGLDSSSVVCSAQYLAQSGATPSGLGGTVTWTYTVGAGGDERKYSDAVIRQYGVRNERVIDLGYLETNGHEPPLIDQPQYVYPFYARDCRTHEIVRTSGGRILLTGHAGDNLVVGSMLFFADWIARGKIRKALSEMVRRAALGRVSFWQLAYRNAFLPLVPQRWHRWPTSEHAIPRWIVPAIVSQYNLNASTVAARGYRGRIGHKYADYAAAGFSAISTELAGFSVLDEALELRHPYLFRPLVEYALQLPPEACVQPHARKWILRQAMRGILPDVVRSRVGKGTIGAAMSWSLVKKRNEIARRLRDPIIAQLGCVDRDRLLAALSRADTNDVDTNTNVAITLAVEMWLQVRSGQWYAGDVPQEALRRSSGEAIQRNT